MNRIAKFEKVSFEQFKKDYIEIFPTGVKENKREPAIQFIYDNIKLPKRATVGSAAYDFFTPLGFTLLPNETIKFPTGIRCEIAQDWALICLPKSGIGSKFRIQLDNTLGLVDSDYYYSDNEGHIMVKLTNDTNENKKFVIESGKGIIQGMLLQYGITIDDNTTEIRNGGFGSTEK